jgi:hypothetical protein
MKLLFENWRRYLKEGSYQEKMKIWKKKFARFKAMLLKDYPNSKITKKEDWDEDPEIGDIVHQGKYWNQEKILSKGLKNECHGNAACAYAKTDGRLKMITGVALDDKNVWYLHSWVYDPEKDIVYETTGGWKAYYGFQVSDWDMGMIQSRGHRGKWTGPI